MHSRLGFLDSRGYTLLSAKRLITRLLWLSDILHVITFKLLLTQHIAKELIETMNST